MIMYYDGEMELKKILGELSERLSLREIAEQSGLASRGHVHNILHGKQKTVTYEIGMALIALHKKVMRRKK